MKRLKVLLILLFLIGCSTQVGSRSVLNASKIDKLETLFDVIEQNNKGMGSVVLKSGHKTIYKRNYGYSNIEKNVKNSKDTIFRYGSISKTITAILIMNLVEHGKLNLDDKLSTFFPEVPHSEKITIEDLLRHRSGLANITDASDFQKFKDTEISRTELLKKIIGYDSLFNPRQKTEYCNTGFTLLSFIAEAVTKKKYAQLIHDNITKKYPSIKIWNNSNVTNESAISYFKMSDWEFAGTTHHSVTIGAGSLSGTINDITQLYMDLFNGKLVSEKSLIQMTSIDNDFGLGLYPMDFHDHKAIGHTGAIDGYNAKVYNFSNDLYLTVLSNAVDFPLNSLTDAILSILFDKDYTLPNLKEFKMEEQELKKILGTYSHKDFPTDMRLSKENGKIFAEAIGQAKFPLSIKAMNEFSFAPSNIIIKYLQNEDEIEFSQSGSSMRLKRKH